MPEEEKVNKLFLYWDSFLSWIKKPLNMSLFGVLLFAFAIRLYYFVVVGSQPLWWDELCYGSLAKNYFLGKWGSTQLILGEKIIRPQLLPLLWSALLFFRLPEIGIRFLLEFVPSVLSVFFVYLVGKETFGKRAGIISAFIFSVLWIHLFYTLRFLTNVPAMLFLFASVYLFILSYKNKFNLRFFSISLFLLSISTLLRYPNGIVFLVYLFILVLGKNFYITKSRFWISAILGLLPLLVFFSLNLFNYGNIFPAFFGGDYISSSGGANASPFAFHLLKDFIPVYLKTPFLIFFILGLFLILSDLVLGYNIISKNKRMLNYLLLILIFAAIFSFFIFYMRGAEDRWLLPSSLSMVLFSGFGLDSFYKFLKKYQKSLAVLVLIAILVLGAYSEVTYADKLIKVKKESYLQMKQGFEWLKQNTPEDSVIMGQAIQPYVVYYSERQYLNVPKNQSEKQDFTDEADYLVFHAFVGQDDLISYLQEYQNQWQPISAWFFDAQKQNPAFVIYKKV